MGHNIGGSDYSNICLYRDTYTEYMRDQFVQIFVFIGTPMWRQRTSLTIKATTNATVSKITTWKRPDKIKVEGFLAMCNVMIVCNVIKPKLYYSAHFFSFTNS